MKLSENLQKLLTEEEKARYLKEGAISFGTEEETSSEIFKRWKRDFETRLNSRVSKLKKEYPESFGK